MDETVRAGGDAGLNLTIEEVTAYPAYIPVTLSVGGARAETALSCVVVEIRTADGATGHGFTAITDEEVIAGIVRDVVAPNVVSMDALDRERSRRAALLADDAARPDRLCEPRRSPPSTSPCGTFSARSPASPAGA